MVLYSRRVFIRGSAIGAAGLGSLISAPNAVALARPESVAPVASTRPGSARIRLNAKQYFSAPGFSFLLFHNNYQVGFQGGLQMIQNGERILDSGDFYIVPKDEGLHLRQSMLRRVADPQRSRATVDGEVEDWSLGYHLVVATDGKDMFITLKIDSPLDWSKIREAGFRTFIYPGDYYSKSYQGEDCRGVFPRQYDGRHILCDRAHSLLIAEEDLTCRFEMRRTGGTLRLADNRARSPQTWFSIEAPLMPGTSETEIHIHISPSILPEWKKPLVIAISQVGYHPAQVKRAVIEMDHRDNVKAEARLYFLRPDGTMKLALSGSCAPWGKFLRYQYGTFDFTKVREPGLYKLVLMDQETDPFRIHPDIYKETWRPTLECFLPIQMCHVKVQEGVRTWHGACHLDDALQAPANKDHLDGYRQGDLDTRFKSNEHIPGLDWGGWHDAGDHDLPAGSIAMTTLALTLAQEEFHPDTDQTTIRRSERLVLLHVPDGKPDLLQQIEYGAESLLAWYRAGGHVFSGIIENNSTAYSHLGDPVDITDNRVYDPGIKPGQTVCDRSGNFDDRWAFTNRNTGLQYETAQTLAAASRVLRGYQNDLADECLRTAGELWEYERSRTPTYWRSGYNPGDSGFRSQEISATAELLITTGKESYRTHLLSLLPVWDGISGDQFSSGPGWTLVRALPHVSEERYQSSVKELAAKWKTEATRRSASNPYGVRYPSEVSNPGWKLEKRTAVHSSFVWGSGWDLQWDALRQYYFHRHLPGLFDFESLLAVLSFVLGCHPASTESFVSGVGDNSAPVAYGFNRADWSYIPGGVFSGCSLIKPDFMELKTFPFLWYQREYVIHGAATYIFIALAADKLLNE